MVWVKKLPVKRWILLLCPKDKTSCILAIALATREHVQHSYQKSMDNQIVSAVYQLSRYYTQFNLLTKCMSCEQAQKYLEAAKQWGKVTNTRYSCQNSTRCRNGVKVLWCRSHLVWLVFEGSIPTCTCFNSENFFVTFDRSLSSYLPHIIKHVINST